MSEKPQPDPVPTDDPPPHPAEPLQIDTPVIQMQDLEHQPGLDTRVSNMGVKIMPRMDSSDERDLAKEDEDALLALDRMNTQ